MQYKPAYMVVNSGRTKVFIGNYDNLADLRSEYSNEYWECWSEGEKLFVSILSPQEFAERKRDKRHRLSLFYFLRQLKRNNLADQE